MFIIFSIDFQNEFLDDFIEFVENCDNNKLNNIEIFYNLDTYIYVFRIISLVLLSIKIVSNVAFLIFDKIMTYLDI